MNYLFITGFILTLIGYAVHTIIHYNEHNNKKSKMPHSLFELLISLGWIGWFLMLFFETSIQLPTYLIITGLIISVISLIIGALSIITKKGFRKEKELITIGIYSKIRHPMYLGLILMHLGLPLSLGKLLTLLSTLLWIPQILAWKYWEEKELIKRFKKKYKDYQKRTLF